MDFQQTLKGFKSAIDRRLCQQFDAIIAEAKKEDELITSALEQTKKIALAGGKRIRGALLQNIYFGVGGKEKKKILEVAVAIEFLHLFFLIHDDIIDCGILRHGEETINEFFSKKNIKKIGASKAGHFGDSLAIIIGDLFFAKANELILKAGFGEKETIKALTCLQNVASATIIGQAQDISIEQANQADEKKVLAMYENKTAYYTFQGPLRLGAIFAKAGDKKTLAILDRYAGLVGTAFQLQDDFLGVFGKKERTGKSISSDIEEGKKSLMFVYAKTKAGVKDRKILDELLGKKNLSSKEIRCFRDILTRTGAKKYAQGLALEYLRLGKVEIEKVILMPKAKKFLIGMAEYLEEREV